MAALGGAEAPEAGALAAALRVAVFPDGFALARAGDVFFFAEVLCFMRPNLQQCFVEGQCEAWREYTRHREDRSVRLTKAQAKMIEWERVARVATVGKGMPHLVPVCHMLSGGKIYFGSGKRGRKVRNVRANPRLAMTVDCYSDDWDQITGVMVQGTARVIERGPRFRRLRRRLYAKYPQYPREAALGDTDSVIIEVTPTHVFSW